MHYHLFIYHLTQFANIFFRILSHVMKLTLIFFSCLVFFQIQIHNHDCLIKHFRCRDFLFSYLLEELKIYAIIFVTFGRICNKTICKWFSILVWKCLFYVILEG